MISNYELRKNARYHLGNGIFQQPWLTATVAYIVYSAITSFISFSVIGLLLVMGPLMYGFSRLNYNLIRRKNVEIGDLFVGFGENFTQSFLLGIMQSVYLFLWSLLFIIPGIVKSYSYSMAFFIQQRTGKKWRDCLDESQRYMNGYKWQLFCLDLSFVGWYLLGSLCGGIGTLFVSPYHNVARTEFFMRVMGDDIDDSMCDEEIIVEEVLRPDPFDDIPPAEEIYGDDARQSRNDGTSNNDAPGKDQNIF